MKKGQIEIVGLLVIVILISLMLFFGMIFLLDSNERAADSSFQDEFQDMQLIDNFPLVLFETDVPNCVSEVGNVRSMRGLMEECFLDTDFRCVNSEGEEINACVAFNNTLENITEKVFSDFGYNVFINVTRGESFQMTSHDVGDCKNRSNAYIEKVFPLSIERRPPPMEFKIRICP